MFFYKYSLNNFVSINIKKYKKVSCILSRDKDKSREKDVQHVRVCVSGHCVNFKASNEVEEIAQKIQRIVKYFFILFIFYVVYFFIIIFPYIYRTFLFHVCANYIYNMWR